jgi:hypothetical protein
MVWAKRVAIFSIIAAILYMSYAFVWWQGFYKGADTSLCIMASVTKDKEASAEICPRIMGQPYLPHAVKEFLAGDEIPE